MNKETPSRKRAHTIICCPLTATWALLHRIGLLTFVLLGVSVTTVVAAVVLISFEATPQEDSILITWETASEVDMFGFYVQRAPYVTPEIADCADIPDRIRISNLIPSEGDIIGASYDFTDTSAEAGSTYYYCLEAVEIDGGLELHGPISATLSLPFSIYLPLVFRDINAVDLGPATTVEIWSKPGIMRMYER
jgi:hypothetical protein